MGKFLPISKFRKTTAKLMEEAAEIPTTTLYKKIDVSQITFKQRRGYKLDAILLYAIVEAVLKMPDINVSWLEENGKKRLWQHDTLTMGLAVNTKNDEIAVVTLGGLGLENKTLSWFNEQALAIREKVGTGKLSPQDFDPAPVIVLNDFSSNDVDSAIPILPPRATLLLTTFRIRKEIVVVHNESVVSPMMNVALTFDHRPIDGAKAAKFLALFQNGLENFRLDKHVPIC